MIENSPQKITNQFALPAMLCGIFGLVMTFIGFCPLVSFIGIFRYPISICALVLGIVSLHQIKKSGYTETGVGMAVTGITCGASSLLIVLAMFIFWLSIMCIYALMILFAFVMTMIPMM